MHLCIEHRYLFLQRILLNVCASHHVVQLIELRLQRVCLTHQCYNHHYKEDGENDCRAHDEAANAFEHFVELLLILLILAHDAFEAGKGALALFLIVLILLWHLLYFLIIFKIMIVVIILLHGDVPFFELAQERTVFTGVEWHRGLSPVDVFEVNVHLISIILR